MKSIAVKLITLVVAVTLSASMASAATAAGLESLCNSWNGSVLVPTNYQIGGADNTKLVSTLEKAAMCQFYMDGWRDGIAGTLGTDDKGVTGTYTVEKGVTGPQMVKVFVQYIANHPEEENKPAGDVLYHAMTGSGLLTIVTEQK
jgi:hypothetical protein